MGCTGQVFFKVSSLIQNFVLTITYVFTLIALMANDCLAGVGEIVAQSTKEAVGFSILDW